MHSTGARALREDDNEMSREAVLLQWERKIEVAERLEDDASAAQPTTMRSDEAPARTKRFERSAPEPEAAAPAASADSGSAPARSAAAGSGPAGSAPARSAQAGSGPAASAASGSAPALNTPLAGTHAGSGAALNPAAASAPAARVPAANGSAASPAPSSAQRRTITITGQPTPARRRRHVVDAQLAQPDRIALWAFLLGLLLVAVAAGTAHA